MPAHYYIFNAITLNKQPEDIIYKNMTTSQLTTQYEQPETLADELFGEDTSINYARTGDSYIQYRTNIRNNLENLVYRIERRTDCGTVYTAYPMYDIDSDEISVCTQSRPKILADKDWVDANFATVNSVADSTARLDSLEYWKGEIVQQGVNTNAIITSLLQRIDRLERMIYNEK